MKLYGIAWRRELPRAHLLEAAKRIAAEVLRNAVPNNDEVGFIGAHDGRKACLVFVDYWGNEDELFHRVFLSRSNDPDALAPATSSDLSVCVWDLHLNRSSALPGSDTSCARQTHLTFMVMSPTD